MTIFCILSLKTKIKFVQNAIAKKNICATLIHVAARQVAMTNIEDQHHALYRGKGYIAVMLHINRASGLGII